MRYELIAVGFHEEERAARAVSSLLQLSYDGAIDLFDAVTARRGDDGTLRIDDSVQSTTKEAASWGAVFGGLLGALIAGPLTGGLSLAAGVAFTGLAAAATGTMGAVVGADQASEAKDDSGLPDEFVRQVAGVIEPGDSAVFALFTSGSAETVIETLRGLGGTLLHTTVSAETVQRARDALRG